MPTTFQRLVRRTWRPPFNIDIFPVDHDRHYKQWGFVIYQTYYGPGSDQQWDLLLENISTPLSAELRKYQDQGEDPKSTSILSANFKLDARSDPIALNGLTMNQVSQLYCDEVDGSFLEMRNSLIPDHRILRLTDEEVLHNVDTGVVKVVQAAPVEDADPECHYQWMRLWVGYLIQFWDDLENSEHGIWDFIWEEQPGALYRG